MRLEQACSVSSNLVAGQGKEHLEHLECSHASRDSTMKEISSKVEPMGTIDYYGRLRLSRRVNEELRRVGLDHLTTEEATTHARSSLSRHHKLAHRTPKDLKASHYKGTRLS